MAALDGIADVDHAEGHSSVHQESTFSPVPMINRLLPGGRVGWVIYVFVSGWSVAGTCLRRPSLHTAPGVPWEQMAPSRVEGGPHEAGRTRVWRVTVIHAGGLRVLRQAGKWRARLHALFLFLFLSRGYFSTYYHIEWREGQRETWM